MSEISSTSSLLQPRELCSIYAQIFSESACERQVSLRESAKVWGKSAKVWENPSKIYEESAKSHSELSRVCVWEAHGFGPCALHINICAYMERNEQGLQIILHLRACFKSSEILGESRKILRIQEKSKIKNCLSGMFSSRWYKKTENNKTNIFFGKIDVLASPRQCDFSFSNKSETIV